MVPILYYRWHSFRTYVKLIDFKEDMSMAQITKDTLIGDILKINPNSVPILLNMGMHCLGCPSSQGETLEEACQVHGVDVESIVEELNA